jgi:flagellar basal-body rod modification protein FlgD
MTLIQNSAIVPGTDPYATATRVPRQTLGQEEFLRLITVQLTNQDPLKPTDDTSFMAQMAQFSALEQSTQMARDMAALRSDLHFQSASALIGREVTVHTSSGSLTGLVQSVDSSTGAVLLGIGDRFYSPADVLRVAVASAPAAVSDPAPANEPDSTVPTPEIEPQP